MAVCFLLPYKHPRAKIMPKKWFSIFIFQPLYVCTCTLMCGFISLCCINNIFIFFFSLRHSNQYLMKCFDFGKEIFSLSLFLLPSPFKKKKKKAYIYCHAILFIVFVISCFYPRLVCYSVILCCVDPELWQLD